jgi:hypothetical protein
MNKCVLWILLILLYSCDKKGDKINKELTQAIYQKGFEINQNYIDYNENISKSKFWELLDLERLKQDSGLIESKKIIKDVELFLYDFDSNNQSLIVDVKNIIDSIKPTNTLSKKDIESSKTKFDNLIVANRKSYNSDSTVLALSKNIIKLLDQNCEWEISNNQILFYEEECLYKYNSNVKSLDGVGLERKVEQIN